MGRKVPFAHVYGVGVLLCRATEMEAYIDWTA
jgi:hypothetical protein